MASRTPEQKLFFRTMREEKNKGYREMGEANKFGRLPQQIEIRSKAEQNITPSRRRATPTFFDSLRKLKISLRNKNDGQIGVADDKDGGKRTRKIRRKRTRKNRRNKRKHTRHFRK